jgi:integrase
MNNNVSQFNQLQLSKSNFIDRVVQVNGVDFEEQFIAKLIADHLKNPNNIQKPTITTAFEIYKRESPAAHQRKFQIDLDRNFNIFLTVFGDMLLEDLRHWHIVQHRDILLARGLKTSTVRKHVGILNAMLNMSFKHLDIDRLSPFRALRIPNEGNDTKKMITVTPELILKVKELLLRHRSIHSLVALIQLNTGLRLSEPIFAKLEDCVLDHEIPHLWVRPNELSQRKTKSSIRAVPLYGASLDAAKSLYAFAEKRGSKWLVPDYARYRGNDSCSAIIRKTLKRYKFRSHLFRHALIDRLKACNDIPTRLAESITGHSSGGSEFNTYGTIGYTLEQKLEVIKKVAV